MIVPTNCEPVIHGVNQEEDKKPKQPAINYFPLRVFGMQKQSFYKTWYNLFSWLEYSVSRDAMFCFPCRHFALRGYMDKDIKRHRSYLARLVDILLLTAHQGIAQLGHCENADSQNLVRNKILTDVKSSFYFSVIVYETRDERKTKQFSICVRYILDDKVQEKFLTFSNVRDLSASGLHNMMVENMKEYDI
ncbi:hypothetical protein PR048_013445 [Dryococelus australis]|uniref:TTF-type domain-containing protein n=1 Tax=Dryococelus australis TaxID=614101 RepID=A0ABQ9HT05_9NEOP|nr:hypothetical protein PR048_013445 [Dryococelus australis]